MQRILLSLGMIVFVGAVAAGATGAFFSDSETSTGNTFAAGELDLKIDNSSYGFDWNRPGAENPDGAWGPNPNNSWSLRDLDQCNAQGPNDGGDPVVPILGQASCVFFNFVDLKPGDYGEDTISVHVQNDAWACMAMDLTGTPENGVNEAELEGLPVDATAGVQEGELQNYLNFAFWSDDGDNVYEDNEGPLLFQGLASALDGEWQTLADSANDGDPLPANGEGEASYIGKFWCFGTLAAVPVVDAENAGGPTATNTGFTCDGSGNNNDAQTDGIVVDVEFYSEQARHNGDFLCSSLNGDDPAPVVTRLTLEKSINQDGVNPVTEALWTLTASSTDTMTLISGAESDPAVSSAVVLPGTYVLTESAVGGFTQTGLVCGGNATPLAGNVLTIAAGEQVVCTFTNTENIPG